MSQKLFTKALLVTAMGLGASYSLTTSAAEVGNLINSDDGRFKISINAEHSKRDIEQKGSLDYARMTEFVAFPPGPPGTEYSVLTETESLSNLEGEEEQDHLYLKLSFAVTPKIEVYGKVGAAKSKIKLKGSATYTETFSETFYDEFDKRILTFTESFSETESGMSSLDGKSDTGLFAGIGVKAVIHEWESSGWKFLVDAQYQYKKMGDSPFSFSEFSELDDDVISKEVQGSLMFTKNTGSFRPYFGVSYTDLEMEYDSFQLYGTLAGGPDGIRTETVEFENKDKVGAFAGFEYLPNQNFGVGAEVRGGAETAVNLNLHYSF